MKRLIATTALALVLAAPAYAAQDTMNKAAMNPASYVDMQQKDDILASDLLGKRVYATSGSVAAAQKPADENAKKSQDGASMGARREWHDVGEINDIVLNRDGTVKAVVLGVGGFLGIGEKDVAVEMKSISFVDPREVDAMKTSATDNKADGNMKKSDGDKMAAEDAETDANARRDMAMADGGHYMLVVNATKEQLESAPAYERMDSAMAEPEADSDATAKDGTKTAMVDDQAKDGGSMSMKDDALVAPNVDREGYGIVTADDLTADELEGASVYGPDDESVGEIGKLIIDEESGKITKAVIDVGGFLGIGERPVAVGFKELRILREENGSDVRVYIDSNKETLEQLPKYAAAK